VASTPFVRLCAAWEIGKYGIRINAICPTHGMSANFVLPADAPVLGKSYEEVQGPWIKDNTPIPLKLDRAPNLLDNAYPALFLASDESMYMSGLSIPTTDGGTLATVAIPFGDNQQGAGDVQLRRRHEQSSRPVDRRLMRL